MGFSSLAVKLELKIEPQTMKNSILELQGHCRVSWEGGKTSFFSSDNFQVLHANDMAQ